MEFTEEQAREAIRQHPRLARHMCLTLTEFLILGEIEGEFTSNDLSSIGYGSGAVSSRYAASLVRKGYAEKVRHGVYRKLSSQNDQARNFNANS